MTERKALAREITKWWFAHGRALEELERGDGRRWDSAEWERRRDEAHARLREHQARYRELYSGGSDLVPIGEVLIPALDEIMQRKRSTRTG